MCGQGPFSNRGEYEPYNGAFTDLMALVVPEALPLIPDTPAPSTGALPKGVSAASVHGGANCIRDRDGQRLQCSVQADGSATASAP